MEYLIETTPLLLTTLLRTLDILSFGEPPMNIQLLLSLLETSLPHDDDPTPTHTFELDKNTASPLKCASPDHSLFTSPQICSSFRPFSGNF